MFYAMQRANGDWFALSENGKLCVPVFSSTSDAMQARSQNYEMLHFKPMELDKRAMDDLVSEKTADAASFLVISEPNLNLNRGRSIDYAQLTRLNQNGRQVSPQTL